jgi:hypothetical protein
MLMDLLMPTIVDVTTVGSTEIAARPIPGRNLCIREVEYYEHTLYYGRR